MPRMTYHVVSLRVLPTSLRNKQRDLFGELGAEEAEGCCGDAEDLLVSEDEVGNGSQKGWSGIIVDPKYNGLHAIGGNGRLNTELYPIDNDGTHAVEGRVARRKTSPVGIVAVQTGHGLIAGDGVIGNEYLRGRMSQSLPGRTSLS